MTSVNDSLDQDFKKAVSLLARAQRNGGKPMPEQQLPGRPAIALPAADKKRDFVRLGEQIAQAMIQAAEEQVTNATNMLEHTRAFAESLRAQVDGKNKELDDMSDRLRSFGETVLDAHARFNGREKAPSDGH